MPRRRFVIIQNGKKKDLFVKWRGLFKDLKIFVGEECIGSIEKFKDLRKGVNFNLRGDNLKVMIKNSLFLFDFEILFNDNPLEGSLSDPAYKMKIAQNVLSFLAVINVIAGLLTIYFDFEILLRLGYGWYNLLIGSMYFVSIFISKKVCKLCGFSSGLFVFFIDSFFAAFIILNYQQGLVAAFALRLIFGTIIFSGLIASFKTKTVTINS